jgi:hypothetical protein
MWEPTGKKVTDRTTGATLVEQQMSVTGSLRWEISLHGKVLGHVNSYEGYVDKKAPGSRIVHSRKVKTMWVSRPASTDTVKYPRSWHGHATRARAVFVLVNY